MNPSPWAATEGGFRFSDNSGKTSERACCGFVLCTRPHAQSLMSSPRIDRSLVTATSNAWARRAFLSEVGKESSQWCNPDFIRPTHDGAPLPLSPATSCAISPSSAVIRASVSASWKVVKIVGSGRSLSMLWSQASKRRFPSTAASLCASTSFSRGHIAAAGMEVRRAMDPGHILYRGPQSSLGALS